MSRIGKAPIPIPEKVKVTLTPPNISVEGPKGALNLSFSDLVTVDLQDSFIKVSAASDHRKSRAMHGLMRTLINNMVVGVTAGFTKSLEIQGVGYRAETDKQTLTLNVGYSNPVVVPIPEGLTIEVEKNTIIHVRGIDKQQVGEMAARIRRVRKPEPYRGKGIRYLGEQVRRKVGKAGGK
ncbi:50S ribosomal protein L6 [Desulfomonile tiedjei]|uniref:Large ribosomal subunit protein uL6 n=1 Tax=Desulfomonile tiedjei (strain ATCC 49306 / DSM 6799 / DCB-1) TaxID=706587 RepID=I4CE76_DESTA|nr:50S ribosomal protein L6 [Desulfomonile tiedjei]AFM27867.1 ribosomal protein L6, bacterial type [Desulfomonile tiedjei DSM 6799]